MGRCTSMPRVHIGVRRMDDPVRARAGFRPCYMWGARSATAVLRGPEVGKFPAGLMPLIEPSLRGSPATLQTPGHGNLSNVRSLLMTMLPLRSIAAMHPHGAGCTELMLHQPVCNPSGHILLQPSVIVYPLHLVSLMFVWWGSLVVLTAYQGLVAPTFESSVKAIHVAGCPTDSRRNG